ncbi:MAG: WS/DGAT domain-containing protein, partial [Candidatus Sericytochromatia bacterium]
MATRDNHRQGPPKPLHAGDMDAVFSEIEKDALPRPTITAVLILDRAPNREVLMDRLERASRTLLPFRYRLILQLREDMRLPSAAVLDPMLNALGPAVIPLFGMMLKHCDFAVSNIPVGDQPRYLAGAKIVGLYPFGPLVG